MNEHLSQKQKSQLWSIRSERGIATNVQPIPDLTPTLAEIQAVIDEFPTTRLNAPLQGTPADSENPFLKMWQAATTCGKPRCRCACKADTGDANHA